MNTTTINLIRDFSKVFILKLQYKDEELSTYLYFSNNNLFAEKSIINDSHGRYLNLINNEWITIDNNNILGYIVEDIDPNVYIRPSTVTDRHLIEQKEKIFKKIENINIKINRKIEEINFLKTYMRPEHFDARFDIEFEPGITNKDEYIAKVAYNKVVSDRFNNYFLCKKIGIPERFLHDKLSQQDLDFVKEKWKEFLVTFVKYFVKYLYDEISLIPDSEANYQDELKSLINEIEEEIKNIHFKDKENIYDVLKVWPTLVSPPPFFLEDIV